MAQISNSFEFVDPSQIDRSNYPPRNIPRKSIILPDEVQVLYALTKLGWKGKIPDDIKTLTNDNLRDVFLKMWRGPRRIFTDHYQINFQDFINFLQCKLESSLITNSIIRYLIDGYSDKASEIISENIYDSYDDEINYQSIVDSPYNIAEKIRLFMAQEQSNIVCFINEDNCPNILDKLFPLRSKIFVIAYIIPGRLYSRSVKLWDGHEYFCVRQTISNNNNSADVAICLDSTFLSNLLPPSIKFAFISGDTFVDELVVSLQTNLKRHSFSIDPNIRNPYITLALIINDKILSLLPQSPSCISDIISSADKILECGLLDSESDKIISESQYLDIQVEIAHMCDVLPFDTTEESKLVLAFRMNYAMQIGNFCSRYKISKLNLKRFLSGQGDIECSVAARLFLDTLDF